jgi:hypothetical protein
VAARKDDGLFDCGDGDAGCFVRSASVGESVMMLLFLSFVEVTPTERNQQEGAREGDHATHRNRLSDSRGNPGRPARLDHRQLDRAYRCAELDIAQYRHHRTRLKDRKLRGCRGTDIEAVTAAIEEQFACGMTKEGRRSVFQRLLYVGMAVATPAPQGRHKMRPTCKSPGRSTSGNLIQRRLGE